MAKPKQFVIDGKLAMLKSRKTFHLTAYSKIKWRVCELNNGTVNVYRSNSRDASALKHSINIEDITDIRPFSTSVSLAKICSSSFEIESNKKYKKLKFGSKR
jgi:hypothetical protein